MTLPARPDRAPITVVMAALVHAGAIAGVGLSRAPEEAPKQTTREVEVSVEEEAASTETATATATSTSTSTATSTSTSTSTATSTGHGHGHGHVYGERGWSFSAVVAPGLVGERFVLPREADTAGVPAVERSMHAALDRGDAEKGLARGGPLRLAVEDVARGSDAPLGGTATFEITVGHGGPPRARLLGASSEHAGWAALLPAIDRAAAGKKLRLPQNGDGLRVVVRVTADQAFVDGRSTQDLGLKGTVQKPDLRENVGPGESKLVLPSLRASGKVCSAGVTLGAIPSIGGGCSLENLATTAHRRVRSELVSEERVSL